MSSSALTCRPGCAACCTAPSISGPIPGMPPLHGISKPAGVPCVQLDEALRCRLFGQPERPAVCSGLQPSVEMCGAVDDGGAHARAWLMALEQATQPAARCGGLALDSGQS